VVESVEGTGRTVDEALENALDEIGLERDEVEVTVLAQGGSGEQARVVVTALEDVEELDDFDEDEVDEQPAGIGPAAGASPRRVPGSGDAARQPEPRPEAAPAGPPPDPRVVAALARDILVEMLDYMDLPSEVTVDAAELDDGLPSVQMSVEGEFGGILIGRHGETLGALQFLLGLITSRRAGRRVRVIVDVEGYRERRAKLLRDMAVRAAERAQRYRQPIFMDPMLPNERRIVHLALQDNPNVSTHSVGEGDNRRVVVSPRQAARFGGYRLD
jgi:spoIIIJ-associated protein